MQSRLLPGSDAQLWLGLVMIVNVRSHLLLLLYHAGSGVAQEGSAHSSHPSQLDPRQEADRSTLISIIGQSTNTLGNFSVLTQAETHHSSGQGQPRHRD